MLVDLLKAIGEARRETVHGHFDHEYGELVNVEDEAKKPTNGSK